MTIKEQIDKDLKTALLSGDKLLVSTLRGLKSAILYEEVAKGSRDQGLPEPEVMAVLAKEAKKRQESADLYKQGGNNERSDSELAEKAVIEKYLPAQMDDDELLRIIDSAIAETGAADVKQMGMVIALVKQKTEGQADGSRIAVAVRQRLTA